MEIVNPGYPFVYRRGEFTVSVNPGLRSASADIPNPGTLILGQGTTHTNDRLHLDSFAYSIHRA